MCGGPVELAVAAAAVSMSGRLWRRAVSLLCSVLCVTRRELRVRSLGSQRGLVLAVCVVDAGGQLSRCVGWLGLCACGGGGLRAQVQQGHRRVDVTLDCLVDKNVDAFFQRGDEFGVFGDDLTGSVRVCL